MRRESGCAACHSRRRGSWQRCAPARARPKIQPCGLTLGDVLRYRNLDEAGPIMRPFPAPSLRGGFALVIAGTILAGTALVAQETTARDPCDPTLLRPTGDPLAY